MEEEEEDVAIYQATRDAIMFAVDAGDNMYSNLEETTCLQAALAAVRDTMMSRILKNDSDFIGLLLYGTKITNSIQKFPAINAKFDLDQPDVTRIAELESFIENDVDHLKKELGTDKADLSLVLWESLVHFSRFKKKIASKRLVLITNQPNPFSKDANLKRTCRTRAIDLKDAGINVDVFILGNFDTSFYNDVFISVESSNSIFKSESIEEFHDKVKQKQTKLRVQFRIPFFIHPQLEISVQGFSFVTERKVANSSKTMYLDPQTNRKVKASTSLVCRDTKEILQPDNLAYYYVYGGEKIVFESSQLSEMHDYGPVGLTLLGFQPIEWLPLKYSIKHSYFVYPNEQKIKASTSVFAALLDSMNEMSKIAICKFIPRPNSQPRLVALVPEFNTELPDGFHMIPLPFADEIRSIPIESLPVPTAEMSALSKQLIKKLVIRQFSPKSISNAVLLQHFSNLEALALQRESAKTITDYSMPDFEVFNERVGDIIQQINSEMPEKIDERPVKKAKVVAAVDADRIKQMHESETLNKLTVGDLTQFLKSVNIKPTKLKADLVSQVKDYFK